MLGREVVTRLSSGGDPGWHVIALDRVALDITDPAAVHAAVALHRPDVVVNCAAFTAVDGAELREAEALRINGEGPAHLAAACADRGTRLIHISTDYVFHGTVRAPYFEDHPPCPGTAYGRTKLAGELAVLSRMPRRALIIRTAWLYAAHGRNFVRTMVESSRRGETVEVVDDQVGSPTFAADVADRILDLGRRPDTAGIFHAANGGEATWYELASRVFRLTGADPDLVRPVPTLSRTGRAPRPAYTVLGQRRWQAIGLEPLRDWHTALSEALRDFRRPHQLEQASVAEC
jgi:dTDP-4-dehydrorhamnose reductase